MEENFESAPVNIPRARKGGTPWSWNAAVLEKDACPRARNIKERDAPARASRRPPPKQGTEGIRKRYQERTQNQQPVQPQQ
jgi:hypothetical protein